MRAEYELENDFKYDLVIRYRLDNILEPNKKLEKYLDKIYKTITNPHNPYPNNPVNCVGACAVNWVMIKRTSYMLETECLHQILKGLMFLIIF